MKMSRVKKSRHLASAVQLPLDFGQIEEPVSRAVHPGPCRKALLQKIRVHLKKSDYLGVLAVEEVNDLITSLLQLLETDEKILRDLVVSDIVGREVRANELTLGRKSLGTLLRHALCKGLQEKAKRYSLDRIGDITSEQIIAGIAEVRDSLELSYVYNERSELEPKISSELLKYFPKFARLVYGPEPLPMS
jgi:hypothetical protein